MLKRLLHVFDAGPKRYFWQQEAKPDSHCHLPTPAFFSAIDDNATVLEVGCGAGRVLASLTDAKRHLRLVGVDWSVESIRAARDRVRGANLVVADCRQLPFASASFDGTVLSAVLTCLPRRADRMGVLREAFRVTKLGGVAFVSDFLLNGTLRHIARYGIGLALYRRLGAFWAGHPFYHHRKNELLRCLQDVGFSVVEVWVGATEILARPDGAWHLRVMPANGATRPAAQGEGSEGRAARYLNSGPSISVKARFIRIGNASSFSQDFSFALFLGISPSLSFSFFAVESVCRAP